MTAQWAVRTANGFSAEKSNPSAPAKKKPLMKINGFFNDIRLTPSDIALRAVL